MAHGCCCVWGTAEGSSQLPPLALATAPLGPRSPVADAARGHRVPGPPPRLRASALRSSRPRSRRYGALPASLCPLTRSAPSSPPRCLLTAPLEAMEEEPFAKGVTGGAQPISRPADPMGCRTAGKRGGKGLLAPCRSHACFPGSASRLRSPTLPDRNRINPEPSSTPHTHAGTHKRGRGRKNRRRKVSR